MALNRLQSRCTNLVYSYLLYGEGVSPAHLQTSQQPGAPFEPHRRSFLSSEPPSEPGSLPSGSKNKQRKCSSLIKHKNACNFNIWECQFGKTKLNVFYATEITAFAEPWCNVLLNAGSDNIIKWNLRHTQGVIWVQEAQEEHVSLVLGTLVYLVMEVVSDWMLSLSWYEEVRGNQASSYEVKEITPDLFW